MESHPKFACIQKYYNNGKVTAFVVEVSPDSQESSRSTSAYDEYVDIFDTFEEAENCRIAALNS